MDRASLWRLAMQLALRISISGIPYTKGNVRPSITKSIRLTRGLATAALRQANAQSDNQDLCSGDVFGNASLSSTYSRVKQSARKGGNAATDFRIFYCDEFSCRLLRLVDHFQSRSIPGSTEFGSSIFAKNYTSIYEVSIFVIDLDLLIYN
jgi:hypothetical protein